MTQKQTILALLLLTGLTSSPGTTHAMKKSLCQVILYTQKHTFKAPLISYKSSFYLPGFPEEIATDLDYKERLLIEEYGNDLYLRDDLNKQKKIKYLELIDKSLLDGNIDTKLKKKLTKYKKEKEQIKQKASFISPQTGEEFSIVFNDRTLLEQAFKTYDSISEHYIVGYTRFPSENYWRKKHLCHRYRGLESKDFFHAIILKSEVVAYIFGSLEEDNEKLYAIIDSAGISPICTRDYTLLEEKLLESIKTQYKIKTIKNLRVEKKSTSEKNKYKYEI